MGTLAKLISGVGTVYTAPFGEAAIEKDDLTPPVVVVTPVGNWVATGFTRDGLTIGYEPQVEDVIVDQHDGPVNWDKVGESAKIGFMIAENDVDALVLAINAAASSTVAAGADQTGQSIVKVGDTAITPIALTVVGKSPTTGADRIIEFWRVLQVGNPELKLMKTQQGIQVEFAVGCDVTQTAGERLFRITDITAPATT